MILISGTSGALGSSVAARVAGRGLDMVTGSRSPGADRLVDFDRPETLAAAFDGVDALLFVSAGYAEDDVVCARHDAVVTAVEKAGVRHVVYTSLAGSGEHLSIAVAHRYSERALGAAAFDVTILRNGLYAELFAGLAAPARLSGVLDAPWGAGRFAPVARDDLADVAARVLVDVGTGRGARHAGAVYELDGVEEVDGSRIAAALGVAYAPAGMAATREALATAGLPAYQVAHTMSIHGNITAGLLAPGHSDLPALLEREPRRALDVIAAAAG